jgi:acyl phosphate:glycerol-3-phosphate acyltransferase
VFPVWLKFRGGKGVATGFGVLLGLWPLMTLPGLAALATWLIVAAATRYVSLASIIAAVGLPVYLYLIWGLGRGRMLHELLPLLLVAAALALLVVLRHRGNIARLLAGTESKIGGSKPALPD